MKPTLMKIKILCFSFLCLVFACSQSVNPDQIEKWKQEIMDAEKAFNDMAQEEGLDKAFEYYAAPDGVLRRRHKIVKGKTAIRQWYEEDMRPNETLTWQPTFIDVSNSGDLAYTYGDFVFTYPHPDSAGVMKENKGIFHTVWKRQADGSWRYVWD